MDNIDVVHIVDFFVYDKVSGRILIQKRSTDRKLFPGAWEIPGGHVENNETDSECIERELWEETKLKLDKIHSQIHEFKWAGKSNVTNRVYLIEATGELVPEDRNVSAYMWISSDEAKILLKENEQTNGLYEAALKAFEAIERIRKKMNISFNSQTDFNPYERFIPTINELADMARTIALKYFRTDMKLEDKNDKTPVTIADREIEKMMREYLMQNYPEHGVIGEEYGSFQEDAEFVWVIDPIDGTKAFATGKPLFGTIIGLTHRGKPILGLIDQAFTRERWVGCQGMTATYNGIPVKVAGERDLSDSRFYTAAPEMYHGERFENFEEVRKSVKWMLYGCDCYAYGLLAMGFVDAVVEQFLAVHDVIGLVPVIKSAGGYVTDWNGNEIDLNTDGRIIAASSPRLAKETLSILNRGFD